MNPVQKFNYPVSVPIDDGKCDQENRTCMGTVKDIFQKLSNVLKDRKCFLEIKKEVLCYVLSNLLYGSEC